MAICPGRGRVYVSIGPPCFGWNYQVYFPCNLEEICILPHLILLLFPEGGRDIFCANNKVQGSLALNKFAASRTLVRLRS